MRFVGVECFADQYFFGRLLNDKNLIRKERNDTEVIKSITERSRGNFCIGIIDIDKNKKIPDNYNLIIDDSNTTIYKHTENCQFLILVGPRQFEHWINAFLKKESKAIESFGYTDFNAFMEESKSVSPEKNDKFKEVINFVLNNMEDSDNHILQLKRQLHYLITSKYAFDIKEFLNIK